MRAISTLVTDTDDYLKKHNGRYDIRDAGARILDNRCKYIGVAYGFDSRDIGAIVTADLRVRQWSPAQLRMAYTFH